VAISGCITQRRNEGDGKGGEIPRAPNHYGGVESLREGAEKLQQCHEYFLQQHICFRKTSGSNMGAPNLFLAPAPSNLVTSLVLLKKLWKIWLCFC